MPEGKSELSILLLAAIERLDEASQVWGWQADQGYDGAEIQKAANEHVRALYSLKLAVADALLAEREATEAKMLALLKDPAAVRINYLRGDIACQALIDEAVLAEREACAEIARTISTDLRNGGQTRFAAALIANSIRSGDRTSSTEES